jgi:F0F1-type ATP synthase membrane subunit c/vacuolar-type H+-ATPase subunit K
MVGHSMTPDDDPGWPRGLSMFLVMVPGLAQRQMRRGRSEHGLLMLRQAFVAFSTQIVLFGVVMLAVPTKGDAVVPWLPILVGLMIVSFGAGRIAEKPLDCDTDATLASSYRSRFFVRIALAEGIALFAFVASFQGAPMWIYYVGGAVTLVRLWTHAAPTRAALARDQQALNAAGCPRSLVAALRGSGPSPGL